MPENDEPVDDLRAVAMTAGAAAARVVETVVRDAQNRAQQNASAAEEARRRSAAQTALSDVRPASAPLPYDSPQRRDATNEAMRSSGVPDEARRAAVTADLLNAADPKLAAAGGSSTKTKARTPTKKPARERGR